MNGIRFTVPAWAINALLNNDWSGLSTVEREELKLFLDDIQTTYKPGTFSHSKDIEFAFKSNNDVNCLAGDCYVLIYNFEPKKQNPYLDSNFKDLSKEVDEVNKVILESVKTDPVKFAQLITDFYFHWKHNTFETPAMIEFNDTLKILNL